MIINLNSFGICKDDDLAYGASYIFGDSLVDAGNNNYLPTLSRANIPPNGIDFHSSGGNPTGRYTNGRTIGDIVGKFNLVLCFRSIDKFQFHLKKVLILLASNVCDVLGEELGQTHYATPFLAPNCTGRAILHGVNYASGGGGIMNATGRIFVSD